MAFCSLPSLLGLHTAWHQRNEKLQPGLPVLSCTESRVYRGKDPAFNCWQDQADPAVRPRQEQDNHVEHRGGA